MEEEAKVPAAEEQQPEAPEQQESAFEPITSQDQLNGIIGKRVKNLNAKLKDAEAKISDYEARLTTAESAAKDTETLKAQIAERDTQIEAYKVYQLKTRIANEMGIPYDAINRLNGTTEDEIRTDAEALARLIGGNRSSSYPERSQETTQKTAEKSAIDARYKGNPWYKG